MNITDLPLSEPEMSDTEGEVDQEEIIVHNEIEVEVHQEEIKLHNEMEVELHSRAEKRELEEEEGEWKQVNRKEKKIKQQIEKIEMYVSSKEKLPKQFTIAKLFKANGIIDIDRVKYINPYKIRIDVSNELSAEKIENCQEFKKKDWNVQRAMERSSSYGVIRDVDLELSDEDIMKYISCENPAKIISVNRLNRRDRDGEGWQPSESVRICFRGSFIPPHVYVDGLRIIVTPYLFSVSQCSKCWKYGHVHKKCPYNKTVCPKCAGNHENCETTVFKCANCNGDHMALAKSVCPTFLKEKKLRELMYDFNCTYRKALTMYVPPSPTKPEVVKSQPQPRTPAQTFLNAPNNSTCSDQDTLTHTPTFAEVLQAKVSVHKEQRKTSTPRFVKKQDWRENDVDKIILEEPSSPLSHNVSESNEPRTPSENKQKSVHVEELLARLKEIFFLRGQSLESKVHGMIKVGLEWLILKVVDYVSEWSLIKILIGYFLSNG